MGTVNPPLPARSLQAWRGQLGAGEEMPLARVGRIVGVVSWG